jgi:hypothetical protein
MKKDKFKIKGEVTISVCDMTNPEAQVLQNKIVKAKGQEYRNLISELHSRFLKRQFTLHNICPIVGRAVIAARLAGDFTYTGKVNYCALGTNSAGATENDIKLGTEVFRKLVSSLTFDDNVAYLSTFFTATETDGTYEEVGHFIDGTGVADSGQLFSRLEDSETGELPVTKSNTESLTIDYKVTIEI